MPSNNLKIMTYHERLGMTVDESIAAYQNFGGVVFGKKPIAGNAGKLVMGTFSKAFYSTAKLQEAICEVLKEAKVDTQEPFLERSVSHCKTYAESPFYTYWILILMQGWYVSPVRRHQVQKS